MHFVENTPHADSWSFTDKLRFTNACIFAVDDNPHLLRLIEVILRKEGYSRLELISDPREVLPRYQRTRPDLVLLDLNMPYLDGYDVMKAINALHEPVPPPVIVLTAQHSADHVVKALQLGARDYVTKPFMNQELIMRVKNLLSAHLAHRMLHDQATTLEAMVHDRTQALQNSRLEVVRRLGRAAEYRDNETGLHTIRMSRYSALLAGSLGWSDADTDLMLHASPMHDVGKIGIPDNILLKPGRLDERERKIMERHTEIGAEILSDGDCDILQLAHTIALSHHEKWDGSGYPFGLTGEGIPQAGRIVAVADVFDALTSRRPYKPAWSIDEATSYLQEQSGQHFDPDVVKHFMRLLPEVLDIRQDHVEPESAMRNAPLELVGTDRSALPRQLSQAHLPNSTRLPNV